MDTPVCAPPGNLTNLLTDVEWAGSRHSQRFAGRIGSPFKACPICNGVAPGQDAEKEFAAGSIGHQPGCRMVEGLRYVTARNL
jgi:hypothetical protein